jgi:hypothetical protein
VLSGRVEVSGHPLIELLDPSSRAHLQTLAICFSQYPTLAH